MKAKNSPPMPNSSGNKGEKHLDARANCMYVCVKGGRDGQAQWVRYKVSTDWGFDIKGLEIY